MEGKKVLILAHKPPYPKVDGGCIAIAQLLEVYLEAGAKVHFIGMETQKHPSKNPLKHPHLNYKTIAINSEATKWGALKSLTSNDSYFLARFKQVDFDNESIAYPHVFEMDGTLHMLYLGNQVGRFGFGWAKLETSKF